MAEKPKKTNPYHDFKPVKYVEQMSEEGRYMEATVVLSALLETALSVAVEKRVRETNPEFPEETIGKLIDRNSFETNIDLAVCLGVVDKSVYDRLRSFKGERNSLVHSFADWRSKTHKHLRSVVESGTLLFAEIFALAKQAEKTGDRDSTGA